MTRPSWLCQAVRNRAAIDECAINLISTQPQTELAVRGHELRDPELAAEFVCCCDRRLVDGVVRPV